LEIDMKLLLLIVILLLLVAACTTTSEIIIDDKGVDMTRYEENLAECRIYSEQVAVGKKATKGAASGAVIGGMIGAVGHHGDAAEGAAVGAVTGGAKGLDEGDRDKVRVVKNCLRGRGYRVLN
jgi:outer membrane lipoprotein SlyB